jgi:hypothetical protein
VKPKKERKKLNLNAKEIKVVEEPVVEIQP